MVDILGFICGVHDGYGLGYDFFCYIECIRILVYFVELMFLDESDLIENYYVICNEFV